MSSFTPRAWKSQPVHEPEHRAEAPVEPPQPRDVAETNNLPAARTAFIGRERDVADIKALLSRHRLLTLVGSGGVGTTRLALQVGSKLLDQYPVTEYPQFTRSGLGQCNSRATERNETDRFGQ